MGTYTLENHIAISFNSFYHSTKTSVFRLAKHIAGTCNQLAINHSVCTFFIVFKLSKSRVDTYN